MGERKVPNPITLGYSPLTGKIYAGRSKLVPGSSMNARKFTGEKSDVTNDAIGCVADKIISQNEPIVIRLSDGRILTVNAEITSE